MKILLVAGRPAWPPRRGDQLRTTQLLAALAPRHEVTLLAPASRVEPDLPPGARFEAFRPSLSAWLRAPALLLRGWPAQAAPFRQPDLARRLRRLAPLHDLVVLQLVRLAPLLQQAGGAPVVADLIDCLSLNVRTRAAVAPVWQRAGLAAEARRVAAAERRLLAGSRRALVVGERDRSALGGDEPELVRRVLVAPIAIAPAPSGSADAAGASTASTVILTGNLGYFANRDAVAWWLREPWPLLRRELPRLRLVVAGDRPPAHLRRSVEGAGGELVARPADLRALLATATVAVAPLRCGSGVPLKVLDAWSAGVPVVASRFAAEGAGAAHDRELLVADQPAAWVHEIGRLLAEPALRARLVAAARARVEELSPDRVYPALARAVSGEG